MVSYPVHALNITINTGDPAIHASEFLDVTDPSLVGAVRTILDYLSERTLTFST